MLHDLVLVSEQSGERVEVSGGDGGVQASGVRGRGVRAHAALVPLRRESRRRWLGRQLVEAGERLVLALGVEEFDACQAIGSERIEYDERPLIGAPASVGGSSVSRAHDERIGVQAKDFFGARGGVVGDLEQGAEVLQERFRPTRGPGSQAPVVDDLDGGCDRGGDAIEVEPRPPHRPRPCRGAGARGPVGKELGVAFVQPRDGVAQPVDGEDLGPRPSSLGVDLDQSDPLALVGADIETRAGKPAR